MFLIFLLLCLQLELLKCKMCLCNNPCIPFVNCVVNTLFKLEFLRYGQHIMKAFTTVHVQYISIFQYYSPLLWDIYISYLLAFSSITDSPPPNSTLACVFTLFLLVVMETLQLVTRFYSSCQFVLMEDTINPMIHCRVCQRSKITSKHKIRPGILNGFRANCFTLVAMAELDDNASKSSRLLHKNTASVGPHVLHTHTRFLQFVRF